ncbi:cobalamin biosynthesis protein [Acetobacter sp. P5B1]|uniref:cobalamin biosynthesis protein n=1 Tax=Acetobacter sp. P5B1 TaxID=2762620 RepID=UPI001C057CB6|nr:cobalamin biosynthesis protein [Acetobacter sp. P5B1]
MSVAGMGWSNSASATEAATFVRQVVQENKATALTYLAVPGFRHGEALPEDVASLLGVPLFWVSDDALRGVQNICQTVSERALQERGFASVAEGCALAGAGAGAGVWLRVLRQAHAGITCAVAEGEETK